MTLEERDARPLVSVISVCRNHLGGLTKTLASVDGQDYQNVELIVVDGDSDDGTKEYLEQRPQRHSFGYVSEPDNGIYDAMNKGLRLAQGELVVFMNAGDCFSAPNVITAVAQSFVQEEWDWGYGCLRVLDHSGAPASVTCFIPFRAPRLALGRSVVPHQAVFMKRALLNALGGFDISVGLGADQDVCYRASLRSSPRVWADFFVDFEGDGAGSGRRPGAFAWRCSALGGRGGRRSADRLCSTGRSAA